MRISMIVVAFFLSACGATNEPPSPDERMHDNAVIEQLCAAPCAGARAEIKHWTDQAGVTQVYELQGSPTRCSHPPTVFFDAEGTQLGAIPMVPVVPGSPEAREFQALRERLTGTLVIGPSEHCP